MDILVALGGLILWLALLIFQLADLGASVLDVRNARYFDENAGQPRVRLARYFWVFPIGTCLGVAIILGVDFAGRLIFLGSQPMEGVIILLGLAALALIAGVAIALAITTPDALSYAPLRALLLDVSSKRVTKKQLDEFRRLLAEIDGRNKSHRATLHASRERSSVDSIRWGTAARFLFGASWWRLIPVFIGLFPIVAILLGGSPLVEFGGVPLLALLVVPAPISLLTALTAARSSLAASAAWDVAARATRSDIEQLIANVERTSRRGVAGLGERVARALQILREQQG